MGSEVVGGFLYFYYANLICWLQFINFDNLFIARPTTNYATDFLFGKKPNLIYFKNCLVHDMQTRQKKNQKKLVLNN